MIQRIGTNTDNLWAPKGTKAAESSQESFADTLKRFIKDVDQQVKHADTMMRDFAVGKRADLHNVMIEAQKADLSLRLLLRIRNKLVEAYQEIMRMQM
ncbi:MAG TPA: flagellar hook-basal body complex protein FliE [Desulfobacterales bacterium]|nr:flagellar hook-basal body complex protein FliE [Desulfobacterales bacterium]